METSDTTELSPADSSKLLVAWTKQAIKFQLSFQDFKRITEWMGCYRYIPPADRWLDSQLATEILRLKLSDANHASSVFKTWLLCDLIETSLNIDEQIEILKWMNDLNSYPTQA